MNDRDDLDVEGLVTDRYLESLLAPGERHAMAAAPDDALDPGVRTAARALKRELARVHPSFRFEERLASDLQVAGHRQRRGGRAARLSGVRRLEPRTISANRPVPADPSLGSIAAVSRPLLIGGALTSAAISIAGAYVAWRRGRAIANSPMARAARAAHRTGLVRRLPARPSRLAMPRSGRDR